MLKKCFVNKLNISSTTDSTEYLYGAKIEFKEWGASGYLILLINRAVDVESEIIKSYNGITITYEYNGSVGHRLWIENIPTSGNEYIIIKDIRTLIIKQMMGSSGFTSDRLYCSTPDLYGSVSETTASSYNYWLYASYRKMIGDIADFAKFIHITDLHLYITNGTSVNKSEIIGSVEDLANGLVDFGKTSGTLNITSNGHITANGNIISEGGIVSVTFTESGYTIS